MQKDFLPRSPGLATIQAQLLTTFAQQKGVTVAQCLRETGLSLVQLQDNRKEISPGQEIRIIDNILSHSSVCPFAMGYEYGFKNNLRSMGVIGHAILSSATLKESIKVASRYYPNAFHWMKYGVKYTNEHYKVIFRVDSNISAEAQAFVLARDIGIIAAIHYDVLERRRDSITLFSFSSPRIQGMELLEDDFNAKFLFNQKSNYFLANAENLNHPMPFSNKQTSKILEQQCQEHLSGTGKAVDIVSEIRCLLMESPTLSSNKTEVAARLNISVRTLARKLTAANTSWNQLLTQLKLNKAMSLLESTDLEIKEIAELVGYSSAGVLSRKLVDTLGLTALEYRRSILTKYP